MSHDKTPGTPVCPADWNRGREKFRWGEKGKRVWNLASFLDKSKCEEDAFMEVIERIDDRCNDGTYFNIRFIWHLELKTMDVYFLSNSVEPWKMKRDGRLSPHCPCSGIAINLLNFVGILSLHLS